MQKVKIIYQKNKLEKIHQLSLNNINNIINQNNKKEVVVSRPTSKTQVKS